MVGAHQSWVHLGLSAMRMFAAAAFANVDERAVFGDCLPRWEIAGVNFYETASYIVRG